MKILNYCAGYDTAGFSIRLKQAFDKHSEHAYRSCIGRPNNYIRYPVDAPAKDFRRLAGWADLIHVSHQPLPMKKPQVVQYHGTKFRNSPEKFLTLQTLANAEAVCSTIDLELIAPHMVTWLPTPYNMDWLMSFRSPIDDGVFRIGHAPTNRVTKSTDHLVAAVDRLKKDVNVELVLIERRRWLTCLRLKGTVDVYFDQVILGYGNNAVEAWGMGIPVIAGAAPATLAEMTQRFGFLPFYEATEETIYEALVAMTEPATRDLWSAVGSNHARTWHADDKVVRFLEGIYSKVYGEPGDSRSSDPLQLQG